jgi:hypothetical protein
MHAADQVVSIIVRVDHSFDNGPDYDSEVTVLLADGARQTVDLDRTAFRDELIELRDEQVTAGELLEAFIIWLRPASQAS